MELERRYLAALVELRSSKNGPGKLGGYAAKFGTLSQNLGGFVEQIDNRAFNKSVSDGVDVMARYNHDDGALLGRTSSGTVTLSVDKVGLRYEVDLPDTSVGRDVAVLAARGDVAQSSFAFHTITDSWGETDQGMALRTLMAVRLVDVAPVNTPAYLDTSVGLRSLAEFAHAPLSEVEQAAREGDLKRFLVDYIPLDFDASEEKREAEDADQAGQAASHPPVSIRLRLSEWAERK